MEGRFNRLYKCENAEDVSGELTFVTETKVNFHVNDREVNGD